VGGELLTSDMTIRVEFRRTAAPTIRLLSIDGPLSPPPWNDDLIRKMRARVETCRRLAGSVMDERAARTLREMADEGEADIERLLAEGGTGKADAAPQ
jgi:hypothetical protein